MVYFILDGNFIIKQKYLQRYVSYTVTMWANINYIMSFVSSATGLC